MIYLVLNILLQSGLYIAAGVIALVRAPKAPGGKGLAFAGGALLVVDGLIVAAWNLWYRLVALPIAIDPGAAVGIAPVAPWVFPTYQIGYRALLVIAIVLLLCAVLSARGKQATQEAPVPAHRGPQGYGPQPGQAPGQVYAAQQGAPQQPQQAQQAQQRPGTQRPQNPGEPQQYPNGPQQHPRQGDPTGPQNPYRQPPQQPRPGSHRRPTQPPEGDPSGPQPPMG